MSLFLIALRSITHGDVPLGRTIARNTTVGLTSMVVSFAIGSLLDS